MNVRLCKMVGVVMVALGATACFGVSTPYADAVVSFDQPAGSSDEGGPASNALGAPDQQFVSVDTPEILILAFTDNRVFDGLGDDVFIYEAFDCGASVDVYGRTADGPCTFLATITNSAGIDLADHPGLEYLDFIRFVGLDDSGTCAGYDLDAVEAINSVAVGETPSNGGNGTGCPIPAPGAVVLCLIGTTLVGLVRRRAWL